MKYYRKFLDLTKFDKYKNIYLSSGFLIIVVVLTWIMIQSFYSGNFFIPGDDTFFHIKRFLAIKTAIDDGMFPFYIDSQTMGMYGYGTNLFYPDIMLLPYTFLIDNVGLLNSYKILLSFSFIICAILSYLSTWKVFKSYKISIIFSLLYTFCYYHLNNLGDRNAVGELFSYSFLPLIFWGMYEILFGDYKRKWYIIGVGFTCIILSHLLTAFIIFCLLFVFILIYYKQFVITPKRFLYLVYSGIVSLFMISFFLFPFIEQSLDNTFYYQTEPLFTRISEQAVSIEDIFRGIFVGMSVSKHNPSYIGLFIILPLILRVFLRTKNKRILLADVIMVLGFVLLLSTSKLFPWQFSPFNKLNILQFPWRLNIIISSLFAYSGSIYINYLIPNNKRFVGLLIIFIFVIIHLINISSEMLQPYIRNAIYPEKIDLRTYYMIGNEYIPSAVPSVEYLQERGNETIEITSESEITNMSRHKSKFYFDIKTTKTIDAVLPLLYYKGYKATLNEKNIELEQSNNGLVQIIIPQSGRIVVWYNGTFVQKISLIISLLTLLSLIIYIIYNSKLDKQTNHHE